MPTQQVPRAVTRLTVYRAPEVNREKGKTVKIKKHNYNIIMVLRKITSESFHMNHDKTDNTIETEHVIGSRSLEHPSIRV